jgi:hypothetical protein
MCKNETTNSWEKKHIRVLGPMSYPGGKQNSIYGAFIVEHSEYVKSLYMDTSDFVFLISLSAFD